MLKVNIKDLNNQILTITIDSRDTVQNLHDQIIFEW